MRVVLLFSVVLALAAPFLAAPAAVHPAKPVVRSLKSGSAPVVTAAKASVSDNVVKTSEHYYKPIQPAARAYFTVTYKKRPFGRGRRMRRRRRMPRRLLRRGGGRIGRSGMGRGGGRMPQPTPFLRPVWREVDEDLI